MWRQGIPCLARVIREQRCRDYPSDIFEHFFYSLCTRAGITAHITFSGKNDHHQCEAAFKAFGIALGEALSMTGDKKTIKSTKGKF